MPYQSKELLYHARELANRLGLSDKAPSKRQMDMSEIKSRHYKNVFGSYNEGMKAAGLIPNPRRNKKRYSDDYLINHAGELAKKLNIGDKAPSVKQMKEAGGPTSGAYARRFGTYTEGMKKAGLKPNKGPHDGRKYSDEELLEFLKNFFLEEDYPSYTRMAENEKFPHPCIYKNRFDSWGDAINIMNKKFGISMKPFKQVPNEILLQKAKELADKLGHFPTDDEVAESNHISPYTYITHFWSWTNFKKAYNKYFNENVPIKIYKPKEERFQQILYILDSEPKTINEICKNINLNSGTVYGYVNEMEEGGLLKKLNHDKPFVYSSVLMKLLTELPEKFSPVDVYYSLTKHGCSLEMSEIDEKIRKWKREGLIVGDRYRGYKKLH